jgi:hypothetical protein
MKTIDLSDLKPGDKAWSAHHGEVTIKMVINGNIYPIFTDGHDYTIDGKFSISDTHPTLFHSEQEFKEYWGIQRDIDAPLTKREQFAMAAMQGILSNHEYSNATMEGVAKEAIKQADVLMIRLNEKP